MARLGILGGSFNPVHAAHVRLGLEMAEALALDGVEFIPACRPPHKPGGGMLPFELRARLVEMALEGIPGFRMNAMEAQRPGPSYTWDTVTRLRAERPGDQLYFILGASDFLGLHQWKRGLELCALVNLAVATRDSLGRSEVGAYIAEHPEMRCAQAAPGLWATPGGASVHLVDIPRLDISASFVRERFRRGANLRCLVPQQVEQELLRLRHDVLALWS